MTTFFLGVPKTRFFSLTFDPLLMDEKIEENDLKAIRQTIDAYIGIIVPSQDFPHHFEAFVFSSTNS